MSQFEDKQLQIVQNIAKILCEEKKNYVITNLNAGSGSFGKCIFVEDRQDANKIKKYAIKAQIVIDPHLQIIDNEKLQSCQDEAKILREIKHKNVVKVYEDYQIKNYHFIEMEQCDSSLQKWVESQQGTFIPQKQFIHFANQLLDGVEYIHNLNYVLRDLSLGNILICQDGTLKLCDFGLAKKFKPEIEEQMLLTKCLKGAAFYYPPEILNSKNELLYSQKGDIWAIGVRLQMIGGIDFSQSYLITRKVNTAPKVDDECNKLIQFILNEDKDKRPSIPIIRQFIYQNLILSNQQIENIKQGEIDYIERYKQIEFDYENVLQIENDCIKSLLEYPQNAVNLIKLGEIYLNYYKDLQKSELFFKSLGNKQIANLMLKYNQLRKFQQQLFSLLFNSKSLQILIEIRTSNAVLLKMYQIYQKRCQNICLSKFIVQ
ncbi:kinase domain protein (macronuclear) [Tetrahymena thermophila SB210]|uniref:Kinase domain protein n=1 Tax=Tetrahymena thermophila (strain SB210) TaxID=312017 RepID=Q22M24_TETTS|nr:kinase domain protein [Tetrahymena thermophila SB210]EAR86460.2 kinase domain protein [Tetrahymena thermophila SB210]|eukprot:XP_977196.2 kinase domain protein [Tetrahymena thermophila SB210]